MQQPINRTEIYTPVVQKIANDSDLLGLIEASFEEPDKSRLDHELRAMIPQNVPIENIYGDFAQYCR